MNHAPCRLAPTFLYLEVYQDDWFRKNATQKEACVRKFRSARFSNSHYSNTASTSSAATPTQNPCQKSFGLLNAGITSVDPTILQHMSEKVERLLNKENKTGASHRHRTFVKNIYQIFNGILGRIFPRLNLNSR